MSNPHENMARVETLEREVQDHPMCGRFIRERGAYVVYYPAGMFPNGARASIGMGKALALSRLIGVMERHWMENSIHA